MGYFYLLYDILAEFLYGVDAILTSAQDLSLTLLCTILSFGCVLLPFIVIYWVLRRFF